MFTWLFNSYRYIVMKELNEKVEERGAAFKNRLSLVSFESELGFASR